MLEDLKKLAAHDTWPAITIHFPASPGRDPDQRRIQIKTAAQDLAAIENIGKTEEEFAEQIEAVTADDPRSAQVIYLAPGVARAFPVPDFPQVSVSVGSTFDLITLLEKMQGGEGFVLVASQGGCGLFMLEGGQLTPRRVEHLPNALAHVAGHTSEKQDHFHAASRGADSVAVHAGGLSPSDDEDKQLDKYAKDIAGAVDHALANETLPLVIAADDDLLGRLRNFLSYGNQTEDDIREHPDSLSEDTLAEKAGAILREHDREAEAAESPFDNASGELIAFGYDKLADAARNGRIELLEIDPAARPAPASNGDEGDLANLAVRHTLLNGGNIKTRSGADLNGEQARGLLRY